MEKKPRSAKQLANDERLRSAGKAKKALKETPRTEEIIDTEKVAVERAEEAVVHPTEPKADKRTIEVDASVLESLMAKVAELEKQRNPNMTPEAALATTATMQGYDINVGKNGIQGRVFKYPIEKGFYPDPTSRLYDEPRLSRYNLRENFVFDWDVEGVEYEKYGVTYAEPRFTVRLFRKLFEDDAVTPNGKVALVNRAIVHEDEIVARIGADKLGLTNSFESHQDMLNEMRYYRFRQWLLDLFTPPKVEQHNKQATQMVIDGKVVEVFDTEVLIEKSAAESKTASIESSVRI